MICLESKKIKLNMIQESIFGMSLVYIKSILTKSSENVCLIMKLNLLLNFLYIWTPWWFFSKKTAYNVSKCGFFWPSLHKDAYLFVKSCDRCQKTENISKRDQTPLNSIFVFDIYLWSVGHWFYGTTFSKIEAKAIKTKDSKVVAEFVRDQIFNTFGIPKAIISDRGTHFCNRIVEALLK